VYTVICIEYSVRPTVNIVHSFLIINKRIGLYANEHGHDCLHMNRRSQLTVYLSTSHKGVNLKRDKSISISRIRSMQILLFRSRLQSSHSDMNISPALTCNLRLIILLHFDIQSLFSIRFVDF